jgi:predicted RNA methylase
MLQLSLSPFDDPTLPTNNMRLKHLEAALSSITREFPTPKVALEQYPTSAHLAASVIQLAMDNGDLGDDKVCLDLGCGTGMLTVGAAFISPLVISVDCDEEAMAVARDNVESVELLDTVVFVRAQVRTMPPLKSKSAGRGKGGRSGRGRGRRGTRGGGGRGATFQTATDTRAILIPDDSDGMPFQDNSVDTVLTNPPFGTKHNAGIDVQVRILP